MALKTRSGKAPGSNKERHFDTGFQEPYVLIKVTKVDSSAVKEDAEHDNSTTYDNRPVCGMSIALTSNALPDGYRQENYCNQCNKAYCANLCYREHTATSHKLGLLTPSMLNTPPDPQNPNLFCNVCDKTYASKYHYYNHLRGSHNFDLPRIRPTKENRLQIDPYDPDNYCARCNKSFTLKRGFTSHLRVMHDMDIIPEMTVIQRNILPDIDDPNFYCRSCSKKYSKRHEYRKHLKIKHRMDLKPTNFYDGKSDGGVTDGIICIICDRKLNDKSCYRTHMKTLLHKNKVEELNNVTIYPGQASI